MPSCAVSGSGARQPETGRAHAEPEATNTCGPGMSTSHDFLDLVREVLGFSPMFCFAPRFLAANDQATLSKMLDVLSRPIPLTQPVDFPYTQDLLDLR